MGFAKIKTEIALFLWGEKVYFLAFVFKKMNHKKMSKNLITIQTISQLMFIFTVSLLMPLTVFMNNIH